MSVRARHSPPDAPFSGSFAASDALFLMTPVTLEPMSMADKERLIQSGARHYSEMLSREAPPSPGYSVLFRRAVQRHGQRVARDVAALALALAERAPGREVVLLSLARAGTPVGALLRRALVRIGVAAFHYSVSIIRDRGIDAAALRWVAERHDGRDVVFVDGWTGKGVITRELRASTASEIFATPPFLTVLADPAGVADLAATAEDYAIPSGLLNGVVSGLVSRSVLTPAIAALGGFHGCVRLDNMRPFDLTRWHLDAIDVAGPGTAGVRAAVWSDADRLLASGASRAALRTVAELCAVTDANRIKPGIAEACRALLRRAPGRVFAADGDDDDLAHLRRLAAERRVAVETLPPGPYRALTVIASAEAGA